MQDKIDNERHQCNLLWEGVRGLKKQWNNAKKQLSKLKKNCEENKDEQGSCQWARDKEKQIAALEKNIKKNEEIINARKASIAKLEKEKKALGISPLKL